MSSDVLYFKVASDSLSSTRFLQEAIPAHGVKYLFLGTENNSLLETDWQNLFIHIFFSLIFKQTKTVKLISNVIQLSVIHKKTTRLCEVQLI